MASAAEQLAANLNFGAFAKATELKKRLWFTLGALIVYRLGTYIPLPGIDPVILQDIFSHTLLVFYTINFEKKTNDQENTINVHKLDDYSDKISLPVKMHFAG